MSILKNINESGTNFDVLFERNRYVTDPLKTKGDLIGALGCCHENFLKISRALKRSSHQKDSKMLRHFVVAISPEDEGKLQNTDLLKAARKVAAFFKDCYVLYAIHTDTAHTHFHVLVCNTRISDGKQISMSESDLKRFKEHCSSVLREYGLRPVEKLDKSDESLEINDDLFPKELSQEKRVSILYEGVNEPQYNKPYYRSAPVQNCGNTTTVNVFLPYGTQGTLFQGRNSRPCLSFKPSQLPLTNIPQSNAVYDGNTTSDPTSSPSNWCDQEPDWAKDKQAVTTECDVHETVPEDISDDDFDDYDRYDDYDDDGCQEIVQVSPDNKPLNGEASSDIQEEKFDPFVLVGKKNEDKFDPFVLVGKKNEDKFDPFIFLKKTNK